MKKRLSYKEIGQLHNQCLAALLSNAHKIESDSDMIHIVCKASGHKLCNDTKELILRELRSGRINDSLEDIGMSDTFLQCIRGYRLSFYQFKSGKTPKVFTKLLQKHEKHVFKVYDAVFRASYSFWQDYLNDNEEKESGFSIVFPVGDHFGIDITAIAGADARGAAKAQTYGLSPFESKAIGFAMGALASFTFQQSGKADVVIPIGPPRFPDEIPM